MKTELDTKQIKSDEQSLSGQGYRAIDWVGMTAIQSRIEENGLQIPAEINMFVDLKSSYRGIHMSRLYALHMQKLLGQALTVQGINEIIKLMVSSQEGLSSKAQLEINYKSLQKTSSLKSGLEGFRSYPVSYKFFGHDSGVEKMILSFEVLYSSTCPQSAKLSKEFLRNEIKDSDSAWKWVQSDQIFHATPHAQRSSMKVDLILKGHHIDVGIWVKFVEEILRTPVQTTVKKADEMEFAHLNSENTMFCEDAARKVADSLTSKNEVEGFKITVNHYESLHPHNASSQISHNFS